jgi:hypothetical protein
MAIAVTLPTVVPAAADLMHIIATKLTIDPTGATAESSYHVKSWSYKPPTTSYLDHPEYDATARILKIDRTTPIQQDIAEITLVVEGFTTAFMSTFVNGALPIAGTARIWGINNTDAANTVRVLTSEFSMYADLDGAIAFEPTGWASATIKLRVNGALPVFDLDASTTVV